MDNLPNLLPCPFCGDEAELEIPKDIKNGVYTILCYGCNIPMMEFELKDLSIMIDEWNRRTPATAPVQKSINEHKSGTSVQKIINEQKHKNESKAGRKTILTKNLYNDIMQYHNRGISIRKIIYYMGYCSQGKRLSVGFVHKVIKMSPPLEQLENQLTLDEQEFPA